MNRFTYQVYYEYSDPRERREPKSPEEIRDALSAFPGDLRHFLKDKEAQVEHCEMKHTPNSIFVVVITNDSEQDVKDAVECCLKSFDLFGKKLE
jgi:hypothetical protein